MPDMLAAALRYIELGYKVFPVTPGGKRPLTVNGFHDASNDPLQVEAWWTKWPEANIGLPTEGLVVIDVDDTSSPWLAADGPHAPALARAPAQRTPRGGLHFFFRQQPGKPVRSSASRLASGIDVRADGGYVVVAPSIGADGKPYQWLVELEPVGELPIIPDAIELTPAPKPSTQIAGKIIEGARNSALASLAGRLRRQGLVEAEVLAVLLAANAGRCSPPLDEAEVRRIATSISRYDPDPVDSDRTWSLPEVNKRDSRIVVPPFPDDILNIGGFIGRVIQYNLRTAFRKQPRLALAGAIALQAVLCGRKVQDDRGTRTNLYIISVAGSGEGKEHARQINKYILADAGASALEGPEDVASSSAIVTAIETSPACLFQIDEFGRVLKSINDRNAGSHLQAIITELLRLFSAANSTYKAKGYADAEKNKVLEQPNAVLYATTVPSGFYQSLTTDMIDGGFIPRTLIFEGTEGAPRQRAALTPPPDEIVEVARWWYRYAPGGDLITRGARAAPRLVAHTPESMRVLDAYGERCDADKLRFPQYAQILARAEQKAAMLALALAVSEDREATQISAEVADLAVRLVDHLTWRLVYLCETWVAESGFEAKSKEMLRWAASLGAFTRTDWLKRWKNLPRREREELLENMIETGQIRVDTEDTGGRPATVYRCAGDATA